MQANDEDDEFKDVKKGLPSQGTAQKAGFKFVSLFTVVGIILAILVLVFGEAIAGFLEEVSENSFLTAQILMTGLLSLLVGMLQAIIFKSKIKSHILFVLFSVLGGIVGGFIGGFMMQSDISKSPLVIGALNGLVAGAISSFAQNKLMGNVKYGSRWFLYNAISWAVIFAIAWLIGWQQGNFANVAVAGAFLMIASGIGVVMFLRGTPQVEFS